MTHPKIQIAYCSIAPSFRAGIKDENTNFGMYLYIADHV